MRYLVFFALAAFAYAEMPTCEFAPGWQQAGERRLFEGENLFEYMNGNSEGYLIYGFRKMTGITCKKSGTSLLIDLSDMGDPEAAFGIFSANQNARSPVERIGMGAQILPRKASVAKGQYYLEIAAEPEGDYSQILRETAQFLAAQLPGQSTPPEAMTWFPRQGLQAGYPRLIPQSVLGIRVLKRGYVAHYENGAKAFVVLEPAADAAAATLEKLTSRLTEVTGLQAGEAGFTGKDKYLGTVVAFRKSRYVAGYAAVPREADAAVLANQLSAKMP
jgi:hypothetical protein